MDTVVLILRMSPSSESTPVGKETNPRFVFERLFGAGGVKERDAEAEKRDFEEEYSRFCPRRHKVIASRLGKNDQQKLEEYLNGVREVERRIDLSSGYNWPWTSYPVPKGTPSDYGEHIRLYDMVVLAFQMDRRNALRYMLADAGSNRSYRHIDVADGHHDLSHHRGDAPSIQVN